MYIIIRDFAANKTYITKSYKAIKKKFPSIKFYSMVKSLKAKKRYADPKYEVTMGILIPDGRMKNGSAKRFFAKALKV